MHRFIGDQCMYGLKTRNGDQVGPARKSTGFMTNFPCIVQALGQRWPNTKENQVHQHVRLEANRTKAAQIYPRGLCKATCQGFMKEMDVDRKGQFLFAEFEGSNGNNGGELKKGCGSDGGTTQDCRRE